MKSIKCMLLGIAFILIGLFGGVTMYMNSYMPITAFFIGFGIGIPLTLYGFFSNK